MIDLITLKELGEMLQHLHNLAEQDWGDETVPSQRARDAYARLIGIYTPLTEGDLEQWERSHRQIQANPRARNGLSFQTGRKYLYLPPIEREARVVPVMKLDCEFSDQLTKFCAHIFFLTIENNSPYYCVGFRIETPENQNQVQQAGVQAGGNGKHDFYHSQLLNKPIGMAGPDYLPYSQPSFPLAANCPVTLFLCVLLTLYGRNFLIRFFADLHSDKANQGYKKIKTWYGWQ